jgi:predicted nucleotide-binding protein
MSVSESAAFDLPQWPRSSVLNVPSAEARVQLAQLIAAGKRLQAAATRADDPAQFAGRVNEWHQHCRQWFDANTGGQMAEEYKNASGYTAEHSWNEVLWGSPGNNQRRKRDIASEISMLESIAQRLPEPDGSEATSPSANTAAQAGQGIAADTNSLENIQRSDPGLARNRRAVMVIYGHDREANDALFAWLRAIGLEPREWSQLVGSSGSASPYIGEVLKSAFQEVQAVVAFFTPDEHVRGRDALRAANKTWRLQARPNVLIEAGMALITHPDRTVLVTLGLSELPSDLGGRHYVQLDGTVKPLNDLASRLEGAKCVVDRSGSDWLDPEKFPRRDQVVSQPAQA